MDELETATNLGRPIPPRIQVLATLRYLGASSLQLSVADTLHISQSSISRAVDRVCTALVNRMDQFIMWPDENATKLKFYDVASILSSRGWCHRWNAHQDSGTKK